MAANDVTEPAVQALIAAINAGDREAFPRKRCTQLRHGVLEEFGENSPT